MQPLQGDPSRRVPQRSLVSAVTMGPETVEQSEGDKDALIQELRVQLSMAQARAQRAEERLASVRELAR